MKREIIALACTGLGVGLGFEKSTGGLPRGMCGAALSRPSLCSREAMRDAAYSQRLMREEITARTETTQRMQIRHVLRDL